MALNPLWDVKFMCLPQADLRKFKGHTQYWDFLKLIADLDLYEEYIFLLTPNDAFTIKKMVGPDEFDNLMFNNKTPNQRFAINISMTDCDGMLGALMDGATNFSIGTGEPMNLAAEKDHYDLMKKLLDLGVNPAENTKDGRRFNTDESNYPLRQAAARGYFDIVKLLMDHPQTDPSAKKNFALKHAIANDHIEIAKYLLKDKRVINKIDLLPGTSKAKLKKLNLI